MSGNRIAERKAAKLPCEWLVAKSGCSRKRRRPRLQRNSVPRSVPKQRPWPDHQPPLTKPGDIFAFHLRGQNRWTTTSYTSEDLEAIASRLQQIADHFNDGRKLIRTGQTKEQATPKAKAKPPSTKALIGALNEADREFADGLTPSDQGQAGMVLRSRCTEEAWPMVVRGDVSLDLAARVCQTEENAGTSLTFEQLLWCWKAETKAAGRPAGTACGWETGQRSSSGWSRREWTRRRPAKRSMCELNVHTPQTPIPANR